MNKKKLAGRVLLLAAVLALAGWPGSPFPKNCAGAEPSARESGAWQHPSPEKPAMAVHPIAFTDLRRRLMRDYARIHYGQKWKPSFPGPWWSIGRRPVHGMGCTGTFILRRIPSFGTAP
jgi:N-acetylmuramoyl-L-alanine amidase